MTWSFRKKKFSQKNNNRANFVLAIIFLCNLLIIIKLFNLQVINGAYYAEKSNNQHYVLEKLIPERGKIYLEDKDNKEIYPVATNRKLFSVFINPKIIKDKEDLIKKLIKIFKPLWIKKFQENQNKDQKTEIDEIKNIEEKKIAEENFLNNKIDILKKKINKINDPYEIIAKKISIDDLKKIEDLKERSIGYSQEYFRYYPEAEILSNISGFLGYFKDEKRGQYGIEGYFDELLRGENGSFMSNKDASNYILMTNNSQIIPAKNGFDIVLTIDRVIQFKICEELKATVKEHKADSGLVIVINPNTGAIIAMCNYPSYNANYYYKVKNLNLFINPAIADQYEPGSVFKAITLAAGLDLGKISPNTTYYDNGCVQIGVHKICNSDLKSHKKQTMTNVLEKSLNTGAIFVAKKIGGKELKKYIKKFGFGSQTGIELNPESAGDISSINLNRDIYNATASFGQGISVNPLQIVNAFAAIANGGKLMKPYLVKEIIKNDGSKDKTIPQEIRQVISKKTSLLLSGMLVSVVEKGHGQRAGVSGYYIAGKTGTAQVSKKDGSGYEKDKTIGSFVGFGPVENPQFAMLVKIDNPKDVIWAESSAAPLFGKLAKFILDYYEIQPSKN